MTARCTSCRAGRSRSNRITDYGCVWCVDVIRRRVRGHGTGGTDESVLLKACWCCLCVVCVLLCVNLCDLLRLIEKV